MAMLRILNGQYMLEQKIGSGAFGQLYEGRDLKTGRKVAIKLESVTANAPQLRYEAKLYRLLGDSPGIPGVYWCGTEGDYNALVMDLMGPSLEDLFESCGRQFSLKTVLMLADEMLSRVEFLHEKMFLHRDLKPENFLIGTGQNATTVHMIDFGFAKKYFDKDGKHIPFREGKGVIGTARYASIASHRGLEQGRCDDLEALGYVLMYFLRGNLPWQGIKAPTYSCWNKHVMNVKSKQASADLCKGYPSEFAEYFRYCRILTFEEKPDYAMLRQRFKDLAFREGIVHDGIADWMLDQGQAKYTSTEANFDSEEAPGALISCVSSPPDWHSAISCLSNNPSSTRRSSTTACSSLAASTLQRRYSSEGTSGVKPPSSSSKKVRQARYTSQGSQEDSVLSKQNCDPERFRSCET